MPRVDAHIHGFPDRLALAVRDRLNQRGGLTGGVFLADLAQRVDEAEFDSAWVLPYAHRAGVAESVNEWAAREGAAWPQLVVGATFHPDDEHFGRLVERALVDLRLRVVKMHCSVGQFAPYDQRLTPLWEVASLMAVPVVMHAGHRHGGETAADEVEELIPVLEAYPRLPLVLAHSGFPATERTLELMERFPNLHGDVTPVWDRPVDLAAESIARHRGRFLFGTDTPNSPLTIAEHAERVAAIGLDPIDLDLVMGGAAAALMAAWQHSDASTDG